MTIPYIEVQDLKKAYKDKEVLKGVNFTVPKGSIFCLLGSNGSGKTTTVKILSTLLCADSGKIQVGGFDVSKEPEKVRSIISLTGQYAAVDEILTGKENLQMIARLCHLKNYTEITDKLLDQFNLTDAGNSRVSTYSGGMRRRLDIAMSLIGNPSIIFLDEPTTGLDPQSRNALWNIIKKLRDSGVTIFLTTQYLEESEQLADTVAVMNHGVIIATGTVESLKKHLPYEYIELKFEDTEDLLKAKSMLSTEGSLVDMKNLCLSLAVDGSLAQLSEIFEELKHLEISPVTFTQKKPTLEDVFLKLINKKEGSVKI